MSSSPRPLGSARASGVASTAHVDEPVAILVDGYVLLALPVRRNDHGTLMLANFGGGDWAAAQESLARHLRGED